ncbi:hypothetical protein ACFYT4_28135 [Streptomyces sp. NPDC004609]|uniref:hypothetical protein n=1 Tax=Streptomyces sp. NPDC004609 TaxID=3364704 RepID=UPI0036AFC823
MIFARPSGPVGPVARDMVDLAQRVRALMSTDAGQEAVVPLGGRLFDVAVSAAGEAGHAVAATIDLWHPQGCGPVIAEPERPWLYWLLPPGTTARWAHHPYAVCVGAPATIRVPPLDRQAPDAGRSYWLRPCQSRYLVGPAMLRRALHEHRPLPAPHRAMKMLLLGEAAP